MLARALGPSLVAALAMACSAPTLQPRGPAPGDIPLRVVSYNVNFGLAGDPVTGAAIFAHDADVICLQETTPRWEAVLRADPALSRYPFVHFVHSRGAGGQAILSRLPLLEIEHRAAPEGGWFPAVRAVIDVRGRPVQVLGLHLRPPVSDSGSYVSGYWHADAVHTAEIDAHWDLVDGALPTIVLGDFNESADGAAIEWLEARGLFNALPAFDPGAHTWRWDTWLGELTHDLDHVLHDPRLGLLDARVSPSGRSDHLPVVVDFAVPASPPITTGD